MCGKGSVNDESVAACDKSLFNKSASSERKNVVVFPDGISLDALDVVVVLGGIVRDCGVMSFLEKYYLMMKKRMSEDEGGANSFKFILSTVTHSSRRRLKLT